MKVRDHIAALAQFDPDCEVLPCFPAGMAVEDCDDWTPPEDSNVPRHCSGFWPLHPREDDTVRETGKRFGTERTWTRRGGQWVELTPRAPSPLTEERKE